MLPSTLITLQSLHLGECVRLVHMAETLAAKIAALLARLVNLLDSGALR